MSTLIYPNKCLFCGKIISENETLCKTCLETIKLVGKNTCKYCGRDLEYCRCKIGDFAFDGNASCFYYIGTTRILVHRFKFRKRPQLGKILSESMIKTIGDKYKGFTFDRVMFVPATKMNRMVRGYDQAEILADNISALLGIPLCSDLKSKFRLLPQKSVGYKNRRKNVKGKFYIENSDLKGKRILLVDDVMTSGSTLSECAKILKKAGAKEVYCITFAITLKK